jgi:acylphosphatase
MAESMKHVKIRVQGQVQGVFFRQSAREKAEELDVTGWARNESDRSVYIEAEGKSEALEKFLEWCRQGPPAASVSQVEQEFIDDLQNFQGFKIKY